MFCFFLGGGESFPFLSSVLFVCVFTSHFFISCSELSCLCGQKKSWNNPGNNRSWQRTYCYGYAPYTTKDYRIQNKTWRRPQANRMSHVIPAKNPSKKPWICLNLLEFYQRSVFLSKWYLFIRNIKKQNEFIGLNWRIDSKPTEKNDVARLRIIIALFFRRTTSSS